MYTKGLKTYKFTLRYVFFVLGVMFLAFLMGGSIAFKNSKKAIVTMAENVSAITNNSDLSFDGVRDAIINSLNDTSADDHVSSIKENGVSGAADSFIEDALVDVIDNYTEYAEEVSLEIGAAVLKIFQSLMIFVVIQVVVLIIAENAVAILAGRELLRNSVKGIRITVANRLCRWVYKLLIFGMIAFTLGKAPVIGILLIVCYPLLSCYLAMVSRYYLAVKDKSKFREVVNFKTVFTLFAVDLTCIVFSIVIALLALMIIGGLAAFYVLLSLFVITNVSVRLNAYVFAEE